MKQVLKVEGPSQGMTQVYIHVPDFENFGDRMDEIIEQSCGSFMPGDDDLDDDLDFSSPQGLANLMKNPLADAENLVRNLADGPQKEEMLRELQKVSEDIDDDVEAGEFGAEDDDEEDLASKPGVLILTRQQTKLHTGCSDG